jgi:predicted transcriptional regulator
MLKVRDIMKPSVTPVRTCDEDISIEDAVRVMRAHNVCRLVVTRDDRATGIVTLKSLLQSPVDPQTRRRVLRALMRPE